MARGSEKGNISIFLVLTEIAVFLFLLFITAKLMIGGIGVNNKYKNPVVSSIVEEGTVFDTNKKVLSMQVPVYSVFLDKSKLSKVQTETALSVLRPYLKKSANEYKVFSDNIIQDNTNNYILLSEDFDASGIIPLREELAQNNLSNGVIFEKSRKRVYPFGAYAADIIREAESVLSDYIKPVPLYNTDITYGADIYLSVDIDVQYLLETALRKAMNSLSSAFSSGAIVEANTGKIRAAATLGSDSSTLENNSSTLGNDSSAKDGLNGKSDIKSAITSSVASRETHIIDRIFDKNTNESLSISLKTAEQAGFKTDDEETMKLYTTPETGLLASVPSLESPTYYILLGIDLTNSPVKNGSSVLYTAAEEIQAGLYAQGKL